MVKEFNEFYVYAFLRKDKTPYYIGKGEGRRAYSKQRIIKPPRDKSRIVFLRKGLTEDKAFEWERFYIKHYGRIDLGTGILRNLTNGGEGTSGWVVTEGTKEKMRKASLSKKVELTSTVDGAVFMYDSLHEAARKLNLYTSALGKVCQGKQYSTGGFLARYWSPDLEDWGKGLFYKVEEVRQKQKTPKPVELTRMSEVFVFNSTHEASRAFNLSQGNLSQVCLGKRKSTGGFTARYLPEKFTD